MMFARDLDALPVSPERLVEVSELAVNPSDGVWDLQRLMAVAVAPRQLHRFIERGERLRHSSHVSPGQTEKIKTEEHDKPVTLFRTETQRLGQHLFGAFVFGLKEVEQPAPGKSGDQRGFVIEFSGEADTLVYNLLGFGQVPQTDVSPPNERERLYA